MSLVSVSRRVRMAHRACGAHGLRSVSAAKLPRAAAWGRSPCRGSPTAQAHVSRHRERTGADSSPMSDGSRCRRFETFVR